MEVYSYEKPVKYDFQKRKDSQEDENPSDEFKNKSTREVEKRVFSGRRARQNIRRLALVNFSNTEKSKFITLTFADTNKFDITNVEDTNKEFKKFIQRMRRRYGNFKYLAVIEYQDKNGRGAVHYHMLSDLPYIPNDELNKIWRNGFVKINQIKHIDNIGAYIVKYMGKESYDGRDYRLDGKKLYLTSKNLKRSMVFRGEYAKSIIRKLDLFNKKEVFTNEFDSEYHGKVIYREYNLKRN